MRNPTFKIDHDIPLPSTRLTNYVGNGITYPWPDMEIGDSFLIPHPIPLPNNIYAAVSMYRKRSGHRDFYIFIGENEDGMRIWRVSPRDVGNKT